MSSRSQDVARTLEWLSSNTRQRPLSHEGEEVDHAVDELSLSGRSTLVDNYVDGDVFGHDGQTGLFDQISNRNLHPDDTLQWLKRFEKSADQRLFKSYERTKLTRVDLKAPVPKAGLVFLPGADKPTVTRLEEFGMVQKDPDQRDSIWRVNTAGQLLALWTVDKDLSFINQDRTRKLLDRMDRWNEEADTVTIDSERVQLVDKLRDDKGKLIFDLSATLIEVDASSLIKLILHFRYLVKQSTPNMVPVHHVTHLEAMMEAARFFYTRCPILFRMGTRRHIIHANDIRYGINDEQGFTTVYPSEGIQQLISVSAAYFNALDSAGTNSKDKSQEIVRPRFLQMLVLLLSMLGSANLESMSTFLTETYKLRSSRTDLELLFLKTIPLASINSKLFLKSLVPAVFGKDIPETVIQKEEVCWENFMQQLAVRGYLLPGSIDDLGHKKQSWLPRWPKQGVRSSNIFGRLQLDGDEPRGFNEVLPITVEADDDVTEITIYLAHLEEPYIISTMDYEHIVSLKPGVYIIREAKRDGREVTLQIRSQSLSGYINNAFRIMNQVIDITNADTRRPAKGMMVKLFNGAQEPTKMISSVLPAAVDITRHEVWLEDTSMYLAVAWKCDGKTISKIDMLARMARDASRIIAVVDYFVKITNGRFGKHNQHFQNVQSFVSSHRAVMDKERSTNANPNQRITDTPIRRTVYPGDGERGPDLSIWFEYEAKFEVSYMLLFIFSQRDEVTKVTWLETQAEVDLKTTGLKFVVAPIKPELEIPQDEEIRAGDIVLLCGKYLVVLVPTEDNPPIKWEDNDTYEMTNWLEIQSVSQQTRRRRRQNQERPEKLLSVIV